MNTDAQILWGLRFDLIASVGGILACSMLILEGDNQQKKLPAELTDWIERHSSTVESWHKKLGDIRHSDIKNLPADQVSQKLIAVFDGVESVMNEANKLPEITSLEGKEKELFDALINSLQITYERYNNMQNSLSQ